MGARVPSVVARQPVGALEVIEARYLFGLAPERLEVVTQFPLSPVGKILKRELRDAIAARLDAESAA